MKTIATNMIKKFLVNDGSAMTLTFQLTCVFGNIAVTHQDCDDQKGNVDCIRCHLEFD